jgi:hypothetical protein
MDVSRQDETFEVMQFINENLSMWRDELKQWIYNLYVTIFYAFWHDNRYFMFERT